VLCIDDKVPCDELPLWENAGKEGGQNETAYVPRFVCPPSPEMWPMLLEKAFAKLCGSYANTEAGETMWALQAMTGGRAKKFMKQDNGERWERWEYESKANKWEVGTQVHRKGRPLELGKIEKTLVFEKDTRVKMQNDRNKETPRQGVVLETSIAEDKSENVKVRWHGSRFVIGARVEGEKEIGGQNRVVRGTVYEAKLVDDKAVPDFPDKKQPQKLQLGISWDTDKLHFVPVDQGELKLVREETLRAEDLESAGSVKLRIRWHHPDCKHFAKMDKQIEKDGKTFVTPSTPEEWSCDCPSSQWGVRHLENADKRSAGLTRRSGEAEEFRKADMFVALKIYHERGAVMSASGAKKGNDVGLVAGHAYSVLKVVSEGGLKLIQLRNPWGRGEWTGEWGDSSKVWDQHPEIKKKYFTDADDGAFWMSWNDFVESWEGVGVVDRTIDIDSLTYDFDEEMHGNFCKKCLGPSVGCGNGCFRFWCKCQGPLRLYNPIESEDKSRLEEEEITRLLNPNLIASEVEGGRSGIAGRFAKQQMGELMLMGEKKRKMVV
jgi:hypothetical protein